jgi:CRISPR type I-E-associated protein CasB/Cse2
MQREQLQEEHVRAVRRAYDALTPGDRATLRRCRSAGEIALEGAFWRVVSTAPEHARPRLASVVACFPAADQLGRFEGFRSGRHLRRVLQGDRRGEEGAWALPFRQLVQAREPEDVVHRLRRVLRLGGARVDWGVLGKDIFYWGDRVRRTWAQDFYSNMKEEAHG